MSYKRILKIKNIADPLLTVSLFKTTNQENFDNLNFIESETAQQITLNKENSEIIINP